MAKCKHPTCEQETVSVPGRRPKEFCSVECRTKFHNEKNKKPGSGKRGRPKGSKNKPNGISLPKDYQTFTKIGILKEDGTIEPITNEKEVSIALKAIKELAQPPLKTESGVNEDETLNSTIEYTNPLPESYNGEQNSHVKLDEMWFLNFKEDMTIEQIKEKFGEDAAKEAKKILDRKNDPKEGSMAFMVKYGVSTYEELKK